MKKKRLRPFVIPTICIFLLGTIFYSGYRIWNIIYYDENIVPSNNSLKEINNNYVIPTISVKDAVIKPYNDSKVEVSIPFYNINDTNEEQQKALIFYENIYMENTGIMYTSDESFDIISVLDGTVKNIKDDEIMGKIIEIENNKNITTIYQSVDNVCVKVGDKVNQGDIIATSSKNNITGSDKYALHFEVYRKGEIINPEVLYQLSEEDINE